MEFQGTMSNLTNLKRRIKVGGSGEGKKRRRKVVRIREVTISLDYALYAWDPG